jgi:uncharacterized protein YjiS (DUF1127 family)
MTNSFAKAYRTWREYRETYDELMRLSNRDLTDIGIKRGDIPTIALKSAGLSLYSAAAAMPVNGFDGLQRYSIVSKRVPRAS